MTFRSLVDGDSFALIKQLKRTVEPRLCDATHQKIRVGDLIIFVDRHNKDEVVAKVVGLLKCPSFKELFNSYPIERFGMNEKELLARMRQIYTQQDELNHGVVGIKIHLLRADA